MQLALVFSSKIRHSKSLPRVLFFCNFFVFFNFLFLFCACKGLKVARIVTAFAEPLTRGTCMPARPNQTRRHWFFERINCAAIPRPAGNRRTERRLVRRSLIYMSEFENDIWKTRRNNSRTDFCTRTTSPTADLVSCISLVSSVLSEFRHHNDAQTPVQIRSPIESTNRCSLGTLYSGALCDCLSSDADRSQRHEPRGR